MSFLYLASALEFGESRRLRGVAPGVVFGEAIGRGAKPLCMVFLALARCCCFGVKAGGRGAKPLCWSFSRLRAVVVLG